MKKSEQYYIAMKSVINDPTLLASEKLEVLETLMAEKNIAKICERVEAEKDAALS